MKYNLDLTHDTYKFLEKLPPKNFKQIFKAILQLLEEPRPNDSISMKGYPGLFRKDIGEYRIIYRIEKETIKIPLIGKRNGNEVYDQLKMIKS